MSTASTMDSLGQWWWGKPYPNLMQYICKIEGLPEGKSQYCSPQWEWLLSCKIDRYALNPNPLVRINSILSCPAICLDVYTISNFLLLYEQARLHTSWASGIWFSRPSQLPSKVPLCPQNPLLHPDGAELSHGSRPLMPTLKVLLKVTACCTSLWALTYSGTWRCWLDRWDNDVLSFTHSFISHNDMKE
jgi:hypothetical protein